MNSVDAEIVGKGNGQYLLLSGGSDVFLVRGNPFQKLN